MEAFLAAVPVMEFGRAEATVAARIRAQLESCGQPIGPYDTLIAATALAANATLTNLLLSLPAFAVTRDEGSATGRLATRIDTLEFSGNASSTINPLALLPVLGREIGRAHV